MPSRVLLPLDLLGALVNIITLVGMVGVMFYLNWRFTLMALSVAPMLFVVVFTTPGASRRRHAKCGRRKAKSFP